MEPPVCLPLKHILCTFSVWKMARNVEMLNISSFSLIWWHHSLNVFGMTLEDIYHLQSFCSAWTSLGNIYHSLSTVQVYLDIHWIVYLKIWKRNNLMRVWFLIIAYEKQNLCLMLPTVKWDAVVVQFSSYFSMRNSPYLRNMWCLNYCSIFAK